MQKLYLSLGVLGNLAVVDAGFSSFLPFAMEAMGGMQNQEGVRKGAPPPCEKENLQKIKART